MNNEQTTEEILRGAIDENSHLWEFDENELQRRLSTRIAAYDNLVTFADDPALSRKIKQGYKYLSDLLLDYQTKIKAHYQPVVELTQMAANGSYFHVVYESPRKTVERDLVQLEQEVRDAYMAELDRVKDGFVENLLSDITSELAAKDVAQAAAKAKKRKQALLAMIA